MTEPGEPPLSPGRAAAAGVASGVAFALAAPPIGVWPVAFLCLSPLLGGLIGRGLWARMALGAWTGICAALGTVVLPLGSALSAFFEGPIWLGAPAALLVGAVFGGGGFAVFAALAGDPGRGSSLGIVLRCGAAWVAGDLFRSVAFTGLPWLLLGQLLAPAPGLTQLAAVGGTAAVSFWMACASAAFLLLRDPPRRRAAASMLLLAAGVGGASLWWSPGLEPGEPGAVWPAAPGSSPPAGSVRVALVQPAIPREWRNRPSRLGENLDRLIELTERAGPADLVVWPENAFPVLLPANEERLLRALETLGSPPPALLLGAPRLHDREPGRITNAAIVYAPGSGAVAVHDKVHRVPFTEYVPALLSPLWPDGPSVAAGEEPTVLAAGGLRLGPLVCYELLFDDLARSLVAGGADVLVNLSNDGYFGGSGGAQQHLTAGVLRAVELRRPLLRATSDGITLAVDAGGRIAARLPEGEPGVLVLDVWPAGSSSLFQQGGHWLGWILAAWALARTLPEAPALRGFR